MHCVLYANLFGVCIHKVSVVVSFMSQWCDGLASRCLSEIPFLDQVWSNKISANPFISSSSASHCLLFSFWFALM